MQIFLAIGRRHNRCAEARNNYLTTMCMPTQNQPDASVSNQLCKVGVVR